MCAWTQIPAGLKEFLYATPSTETGVEPRYAALNTHLQLEMSQLQSVDQELALLKRLASFLGSVKPK